MVRTKIICLLFFGVMLAECKTESSYSKFIVGKSGLGKSSQIIFGMLNNELKTASRIIYLFEIINHLPTAGTKDFNALVYSYDSKQIYAFSNTKLDRYEIKRTKEADQLLQFILANYLDDKQQYLKSLQKLNLSDGGLGAVYLFDVNPSAGKIDSLVLESIVLGKDGKPVSFEAYMKQ